jgi:hypothetical protein
MTEPGSSHVWDDDTIASITPDVMRCLSKCGFFEELDNYLCPNDTSIEPECCGRNYMVSEPILKSKGFNDADIADIFAALKAQGGFCDCEILYNVAENSRLKAKYWRAKVEEDRQSLHRMSHRDSK